MNIQICHSCKLKINTLLHYRRMCIQFIFITHLCTFPPDAFMQRWPVFVGNRTNVIIAKRTMNYGHKTSFVFLTKLDNSREVFDRCVPCRIKKLCVVCSINSIVEKRKACMNYFFQSNIQTKLNTPFIS